MISLEMRLRELPESIKYENKVYTLFIYKDFGGWCVSYALGRYFCDADNGCCDFENGILYEITTASLIDSVQKIHKWLEKRKKIC